MENIEKGGCVNVRKQFFGSNRIVDERNEWCAVHENSSGGGNTGRGYYYPSFGRCEFRGWGRCQFRR